jgi:hypothetical protein
MGRAKARAYLELLKTGYRKPEYSKPPPAE